MYLASARQGATTHYFIRQSRLDPDSDCYIAHLIFDLGTRPAEHFDLLDDEIPLFSTKLQEAVSKHSRKDPDGILEELLRPFFPVQARERIDRFRRPPYTHPRPLDAAEQEQIDRTVHIFDRRRLYYLYYGAIDQSRLYRMHEKLCRPLLRQSRDEREFHFMRLESALSVGEYYNYVYAIFNLQRHFEHSLAAVFPEALSRDEIGDWLCKDICRLNSDAGFFFGEQHVDALHTHLRRYLTMFFDFEPQQRFPENEFIRNFINNHRTFRWPEKRTDVSEEKIEQLFSVPSKELEKMDRRALTRLYRKKALSLHPDQGGDQELFVEMTEVYQQLMKRKPHQ